MDPYEYGRRIRPSGGIRVPPIKEEIIVSYTGGSGFGSYFRNTPCFKQINTITYEPIRELFVGPTGPTGCTGKGMDVLGLNNAGLEGGMVLFEENDSITGSAGFLFFPEWNQLRLSDESGEMNMVPSSVTLFGPTGTNSILSNEISITDSNSNVSTVNPTGITCQNVVFSNQTNNNVLTLQSNRTSENYTINLPVSPPTFPSGDSNGLNPVYGLVCNSYSSVNGQQINNLAFQPIQTKVLKMSSASCQLMGEFLNTPIPSQLPYTGGLLPSPFQVVSFYVNTNPGTTFSPFAIVQLRLKLKGVIQSTVAYNDVEYGGAPQVATTNFFGPEAKFQYPDFQIYIEPINGSQGQFTYPQPYVTILYNVDIDCIVRYNPNTGTVYYPWNNPFNTTNPIPSCSLFHALDVNPINVVQVSMTGPNGLMSLGVNRKQTTSFQFVKDIISGYVYTPGSEDTNFEQTAQQYYQETQNIYPFDQAYPKIGIGLVSLPSNNGSQGGIVPLSFTGCGEYIQSTNTFGVNYITQQTVDPCTVFQLTTIDGILLSFYPFTSNVSPIVNGVSLMINDGGPVNWPVNSSTVANANGNIITFNLEMNVVVDSVYDPVTKNNQTFQIQDPIIVSNCVVPTNMTLPSNNSMSVTNSLVAYGGDIYTNGVIQNDLGFDVSQPQSFWVQFAAPLTSIPTITLPYPADTYDTASLVYNNMVLNFNWTPSHVGNNQTIVLSNITNISGSINLTGLNVVSSGP